MQCLTKLLLIHVMLILSDTDGFRINLNQFCQRILQSSCNRSCTSLSHIKFRKFFCCNLAGRIYRCTSFIYNYVLHFLWNFLQKLHNNLFRLSGCGSITQWDQRNIILWDNLLQQIFGCFNLLWSSRCRRINNRSANNFPGWIYHRKLATGTKCRIPPQYCATNDRRLHQKLFQVLAKHLDCTIFCLLCQFIPDLAFDSRCDQSLISVLNCCFNSCCDFSMISM